MKERAIAIGFLIFSLVYLAGSISLQVGTLDQPGAGFMPAFFAAALLITAAYNVYKSLKETSQEEEAVWFQKAPIGIAISLIIYPFILEPVGYLISTFIVLAILLVIMQFKSVWISLLTALVSSFASFILFAVVFSVILPGRFIEDLILSLF